MASLVIRSRQKRHKMRFISENDDDMVVKSLSVPPGLEALMEGLTKEVLRIQPQDICLFASEHFAKLCKMRDSAGDGYKFCKTTIHDKNKKNIPKPHPESQKPHPKDDVEMLDADQLLTVPLLDLGRLSATSTSPEIKFNRSEASTAEIDKMQNGFFHSAANFINVAQVAGRVFVNSPKLTDVTANKEDISNAIHVEDEEPEAKLQENNELISDAIKETEGKIQEDKEKSALISEANLDEEIEDAILADETEAIQENNELVSEVIKETEAKLADEIIEESNIEDNILVDETYRQDKFDSDDKETVANIAEDIKEASDIEDNILVDEDKDEFVLVDKEIEANIAEATNIEDKILVDETDKDEELLSDGMKDNEATLDEDTKENKILVDETEIQLEKDELDSEVIEENNANLSEELIEMASEETQIEDSKASENAEENEVEAIVKETNEDEIQNEVLKLVSEQSTIDESAADLSEFLDEVDTKLSTEDESELTTETVIHVPENLEEIDDENISEIELADEKLENENLKLTEEVQNETENSGIEELAVDTLEDNINKLTELISEEKITEKEEFIKSDDTIDQLDDENGNEEIKVEEAGTEELKENIEFEQNEADIEEIQKQENNLEASEETLKEAIELQEEINITNDIKNELLSDANILLTDEEKIEDNFDKIAENVITAESIIDKIDATDIAAETPEIINTEIKVEEQISENLDEIKENEEHDRKKRSIDDNDFSKLPIPKISTTNATPTPSEDEHDLVDHSIKEPTLLGVPAEEEYDEAKLNKSALLIQSIWRGYNIRKFNKSLKALEERDNNEDIGKENIAATLIQSLWRGHNTRKQNLIPQTAAKEEIRNVAIEEIIAATKLQSIWRGFAIRKAMKFNAPNTSETPVVNEEKEHDTIEENMTVSSEKEEMSHKASTIEEILAVTKLQAVWRGFAIRKGIKSQVSKIEESSQAEVVAQEINTIEEIMAAIKLQSVWRGFNSRKVMKSNVPKIKPTDNEVNTIEEIMAAIKLQSVWRGFITRKAMKTNTAESEPEMSSVETKLDDVMKEINAAIRIQSIWRGFKARKLQKLGNKNSENEKQTLANIVDESEKEFLAATLIQSLWRGHLIRKDKNMNGSTKYVDDEVMKQAVAATLIQSLWRGHTIRKNKKMVEIEHENIPVTEEVVKETAVHLENVLLAESLELEIEEKNAETLDEVDKEDKPDLEAVLLESTEETAQTNASDVADAIEVASPEVILDINEEQTGEIEPQTTLVEDIDNQAANENAAEDIKEAIEEEETAIVETLENSIDGTVNDEDISNGGNEDVAVVEEREQLVEVADEIITQIEDAINDATNEDKEELSEGEIITSSFDIANHDLTKLEVIEHEVPVIDEIDTSTNLEEETDTTIDTAENIFIDTMKEGEENDSIKEAELENLDRQIITQESEDQTEEQIKADIVENKLEDNRNTGEELTEPGINEEHVATSEDVQKQEEAMLKQIIAATTLQSAWRGYNYRNTNKVDKTEEPHEENNEDKEKVSENTTENLKILETVLENTDNPELASEHQQLEDDSVINITEPIIQNLNLKTEEIEHQISTIEENEPTKDDIQTIVNQEDSSKIEDNLHTKSIEDKAICKNQEESPTIGDSSETDNNITDTQNDSSINNGMNTESKDPSKIEEIQTEETVNNITDTKNISSTNDLINTEPQDHSGIEDIQTEDTSEVDNYINETQNEKDEINTESTIISVIGNNHETSNIIDEINEDESNVLLEESSENRSTEAQTGTIEEDIKIEPIQLDEPVKEETEVIESIGKEITENNEEAKMKEIIPEEKLVVLSSEKSENVESKDDLNINENSNNKIEDTPSVVEDIECDLVENNPVHEEIIAENIIDNISPINDEITGTKVESESEENVMPISAEEVDKNDENLNSTDVNTTEEIDETDTSLKGSQDQSEASVHETDNDNSEFKNTKDPFEESEASTIDIKDIDDYTQSINSTDQHEDSKILDEPFEQFPNMKQTPLRKISSNLELFVQEANENLNDSSIKVNGKLKDFDASLDSLSEDKVTFFIGPNKESIIAVSTDSDELDDNEEGNEQLVDDVKLKSEEDDDNKEDTLEKITDAIDDQAKISSVDAESTDIEENPVNTPVEILDVADPSLTVSKEDSVNELINSTSNPIDLTIITLPEVNKIEDSTNNLIPSDISEKFDNIKVVSEESTDEVNNILKEENEKHIIDKVNDELDEVEALNLRLQNLSRTHIYRSESPEDDSKIKIKEADNTLKDSIEDTVGNKDQDETSDSSTRTGKDIPSVHDGNDINTIPGTVETDTTKKDNHEETQTGTEENSELGKNIESFDKALLEVTEPIFLRSYVDKVIIDKNEDKDDGQSHDSSNTKDETVEQESVDSGNVIQNGKDTNSSDVTEDSKVEGKQENDEINKGAETTENKIITVEDVEPNMEQNSTKIDLEEETEISAENLMHPDDSSKVSDDITVEKTNDLDNENVDTTDIVNKEEINKEQTVVENESVIVEAATTEDNNLGNIENKKLNEDITEESEQLSPSLIATDQSTIENISNEIHNQAAVKIQSAWKGHNTRQTIQDQRELAELQKPAECDETPDQNDIISKAATTIQAGARGYLVRKRRNAPTITPQENSSLTIDESADNISVASMVTVIEKPIPTKSPETQIEANQIKQSTDAPEEEENNKNEDDLVIATDTKATSIIPENEDTNTGKVSEKTEDINTIHNSEETNSGSSTKEEPSAELDEMEALNLRLQNLSRSNVYRSEETLNSNTSSTNNTPTHKIESSLKETIVNDAIVQGEDNQNEETKKEHINVITQPEQDTEIVQIMENPVVTNEPRRSVNFDEIDIDSSKYDLKVDQHTPRSKNASPVHELSTAALKISAAITGEDDSIADALEEKNGKKEAVEEKAVEYIHIPLQGPIPEVTQKKIEAVKENKSDTDSPDYIYIPLKDPGMKEEIETKSSNVQEIQSEETPLAPSTNTEHLKEDSIDDLSTTIEENTDNPPAEDTDASKEDMKEDEPTECEIIDSKEALRNIPVELKSTDTQIEDTVVEVTKEDIEGNNSNKDINNELLSSDIHTHGNTTPTNPGTLLKQDTTEIDLKGDTLEKKNIVVDDTKEDTKENASKVENNTDSSESDTLRNITSTTSETVLKDDSPGEKLIEETTDESNGSAKSPRTKSSINDIDAFLERNKQRTITRQENVESSGRRKLFDEIDSIIESYGQKRQMSPTSSSTDNTPDLEPLKIADESSVQGHQLFDDLATEPNVIIAHNSDAAATKIQSAFRGFRTRQQLKNNKDALTHIDLNKQGIPTERKNSLGSDKTYTVARSPTNISTPEDVSSDEETVKNLAASKIQKTYRNYRNKQKSLDEEDLKNEAASKIQESYKNYRQKRSLSLTSVGKENFPDIHQVQHLKISDIEDKFLDYPSSPPHEAHEELKDISEISHCAATKIQSTYRGFKTRQGLQNNESDLETIPEIGSLISADTSARNTAVEHVISEVGLKDGHSQVGRLMNEEVSTIQKKINGLPTKIHTESGHHNSSYENENNQNTVRNDRYDSDDHNQLVSDDATDEEIAKDSTTTTTTSGIRSESSIYDEDESDESDAKSAADVRHQVAQGYDADTENRNAHGNGENPRLQHSGEMHDSVDIFLSSEELSQGAEVLTSRVPKTDDGGDDSAGGRSIIGREA